MDTSIADKLMESQTASFTADRIKRRNNDSLRSIVYNDFNATGCFKCTDITTFTSDDTSFHFVVIDMEYRNSILYGSFCCHSLNGLYHNFLSLSIGVQLGLIHNFVDIASSISLSFILHGFNQSGLCFVCTQSREFFQLSTLLQLHLLKFFVFQDQQLLFVVNARLQVVEFILSATQFLLTLVERDLTLFQSIFALLDMLVALLHFLFQFAFLIEELLFDLEQFLLFDNFGFLIGSLYHFIIFSFDDMTENHKATESAN